MHTEGDEEGSSQQDEGEVAIPAEIAADFILIESQVFGDFQIPLRYASERRWPAR